MMEDKKANITAASSVIILIIFIIVARVSLKLSSTFYLICGAGVAVIIAVFAWLLIRHHYNYRRKQMESQYKSEGRELRIEYSFLRKVAGVPTKFRYNELEEATDNFKALLGQGASAKVFKGILSDGTPVAVKRLDVEERGDREFKSEVSAIASLQHVNLVRLVGYCCVNPAGPRFLVYDFISNGSLDGWIFNKKVRPNHRGGCLSWDLRYRVSIDVARALSYLHHDCRKRVLHLDVKPENILLDENFRAIVADFGLSKLMGRDESNVMTTIRGTRGYLAPEWLLEHGISEKSDTYSYGMVLLEMIGGRRNVSFIEKGAHNRSNKKWQYFPKTVNEKMREGKLMEIVDQRLLDGGGIDERELKRLVHVAIWCIQERASLRPSMSHVVEMLEKGLVVEQPPDTQMTIVDFLTLDEEESQSQINGHHRPDIVAALAAQQVDRNDENLSSAYSYATAMSDITPR
ncbi:hypothetical protein ACLB2K_008960 [Fragaria x ananassa]